mmetsp:Transcript_36715/g.90362  ORF Transcript_36715/g.90362 Transcript_36715/m.90362 type:complete len:209 (+) Transcript_36715:185-811(+)
MASQLPPCLLHRPLQNEGILARLCALCDEQSCDLCTPLVFLVECRHDVEGCLLLLVDVIHIGPGIQQHLHGLELAPVHEPHQRRPSHGLLVPRIHPVCRSVDVSPCSDDALQDLRASAYSSKVRSRLAVVIREVGVRPGAQEVEDLGPLSHPHGIQEHAPLLRSLTRSSRALAIALRLGREQQEECHPRCPHLFSQQKEFLFLSDPSG